MPFPFQEALSFSDHLLAGGVAYLFVLMGACVCGGSVISLLAKSRASESIDPRWDDLALRCAKTTRALAAWAVCPLGLGLWVVMMAQRPRMMEQLHLIFLVPALLGLLLFGLGLCFSGRYISTWGRGRHENRLHMAWGVLSAVGFWSAAAVLVSVCAFSAHTGAWAAKPTLWNAFWNPAFPAVFLTWAAVSILTFGAFGLLYAASRNDSAWRVALVHELGKWMVAGAVTGVLGWIWWGVSLPESENRNLVIGLVATAVAAQAVLGSIGYRWGVRDPEKRHRRHACAASLLVVFLLAACGWVYVEAKGNFQIHQYMYRNGMIIEEAEDANRTGLSEFRESRRAPAGAGGTRRIQFPCAVYGLPCGLGEAAGPGPGPGVQVRGRRASVSWRDANQTPAVPSFGGRARGAQRPGGVSGNADREIGPDSRISPRAGARRKKTGGSPGGGFEYLSGGCGKIH